MDDRIYSEKLREIAKKGIAANEFTGAALASHCGISQAHLSNLLHGKRNFRLSVFFALLHYLHLTIEDLEEPPSKSKASVTEFVPVVSQVNAMASSIITPKMVLSKSPVALPSRGREIDFAENDRWSWTRFVAVHPTLGQIKFLDLNPQRASLIVIDRQNRSVDLRAAPDSDLHAISSGKLMSIGCLRESDGHTLLLPRSRSLPRVVTLAPQRNPTHQIVGKVYGIWFAFGDDDPGRAT